MNEEGMLSMQHVIPTKYASLPLPLGPFAPFPYAAPCTLSLFFFTITDTFTLRDGIFTNWVEFLLCAQEELD
jgi:hypothetical protein